MGGLAGHRRQANIPSQEAMRISLLLCALAAASVCGLSEELSDDGLSELGRRAGGEGALAGMLNLSPGADSNTAGNDEALVDLGEHSCETNTEKDAKIKEGDVKINEKDVENKELKERL